MALPIELQQKLISLEAALTQRSPQIKVLCQEIHRTLKQQPENVTLLSEEEIAIVVGGLKVQTLTEFAVSTTKKPATANKSLKAALATGADDLF